MPPTPDTTPFNPTPEETDRLLTLYLDPTLSLADLAREAGVSPLTLQAWLASPETAAHLDQLEQAAARRVRHLAGAHLPAAIGVLTTMLREHLDAQQRGTLAADPQIRCRQHEGARRAANLLVRLSRWTPGPAPARTTAAHPNTPQPRRPRSHQTAAATDPDPALLARFLSLAAPAPSPAALAQQAPPAEPTAPTTTEGDPSANAEAAGDAHLRVDPNPAGDPIPEAATAPSPSVLNPETLAALERLSTIPDDCPADETNRLIATVLRDPTLPALLALAGDTPAHPPLREAG